ncbi:MAG: aldehyde dehydrogenase (NADP(+)) [Pirellulaceae bacterium]|nr:aldehyde dehydrogenase (NADP(+)) [Pirellulaceae bacterium]
MSTTSRPLRETSSATQKASPVLIDGVWCAADASSVFQASNPNTGEPIAEVFPVSKWSDCERAIAAASEAFVTMQSLPATRRAEFLESLATKLEQNKESLVAKANEETGLPTAPRLGDVELPRTVNQLRQAATAARSGSWALATIDTKLNIRSVYESLGPICVFGPNNFPFAYNGVVGGDFASAIAAGNPVIGKANSSHPGTTKLLAEQVLAAMQETKMPSGLVQLLYRTSHEDGMRLVADHRVGATGYTGSRRAGLQLKAAADAGGKPFYAELSSVNPVVILPNALVERAAKVVEDFATSGLMGAGQFCTSPGIVLLFDNDASRAIVAEIASRYEKLPAGTLLSKSVQTSLVSGIDLLKSIGAKVLVGGQAIEGSRCAVANTLMQATGQQFLSDPMQFQTEAFGNAALMVLCRDVAEIHEVIQQLEGNLTGCIYSATDGSDDESYNLLAPTLATKVGRVLNDKMPTGVAVSPAMNHGGPYPATSHPGFTAVGIPASLLRFAKLTCYDAVRSTRLPLLLKDDNPTGETWRSIDGKWSQGNVGS